MTLTPKYLVAAGCLSAALGVTSIPQTASAQSLTCGGTYTVRSGDSLSGIAARVYGDPKAFQFIFSANADTIGDNPSLIKVGNALNIPCIDSTTESTAPQLTVERGVERLPFPNQRQMRLMTGTDWAPFTNEDQEQGGMLVEMVNAALSKSDQKPEYKIDFVNDWGAHLSPMLTDIAYDFSIAWYQPNCDVVSRLGEDSQFRCNNFDWADPIYEQIMGYYIRASDPIPQSYDDLMGKTICRPAGYSLFFLEEDNLKEPNITLAQPNAVVDCMNGLHDGSYDVVVLAPEVAEVAMAEIGVTDKTVFAEPLSKVILISAVISKNHPQKEAMLAQFNSAMSQLKESGEWFQIVLRHLKEHKENTQ